MKTYVGLASLAQLKGNYANPILVNHLSEIGIRPVHVSNSVISGRLRLHLANWEVITQDQWVLHGYKIDFVHTPRQPNPPIIPRFSKEELVQVKQAVTELTAKG